MKKRYKSLKDIKQTLEQLIGKPVNCYYDLGRGFTMVRYDTDKDHFDDEDFTAISHYEFEHFQEHRHPFLVIPNCKG